MRLGRQQALPSCCGVDDLGGWAYGGNTLHKSGTGLFTATFTNHNHQMLAYEQMCRDHRLLYQSPVRRNSRSGNKVFLCVFEWKAQPRRRGERAGENLPNL